MDNATLVVEFTRLYLAVFYTAVAVFYALRITAKHRSVARPVVFPGATYSATWWNHLAFRLFRFLIWVVCVLRLFFPSIDQYIGVIPELNRVPVLLAGNVLLTLGFLLAIFVHFDLKKQWRSGIDPQGPETLKTDGPFRFSRNPMFLGVAISQFGFVLALPSLFAIVCWFVGAYALHRQTLAEEAHLLSKFPKGYPRYAARVRRWL